MALKSRRAFFETEEGLEIKKQLQSIAENVIYNTGPSYSANSEMYPDHRIPFVDKHMNYLISHPSLDADKYLANIRIMTKVR
jgi:hypothetical protein